MLEFESDELVIFSLKNKYKDWEFIKSLFSTIDMNNKTVLLLSVGGEVLPPNSSLSFNEYALINSYKTKAEQSGRKVTVIIESLLEAPTYKYNLKSIISVLSVILKIPQSEFIILSGALHQFDAPVKNSPSLMIFGNHITSENTIIDTIPTKHFISLSRIAKHHRILGTIEILERNLKDYGLISLGSGYYTDPSENYFGNIPEKYKNIFPLHIDGIITEGETNILQYNTSGGLFLQAFLNVVFETSYEHEVIKQSGWNVPFLTEKSAKPFIWGQVPIFIAYEGTVKYLKDYGFDLFDDIIDHSYDNEKDPINRIRLAIDQLEQICSKSINYWQDYKKENLSRFKSNRNTMETFNNITKINMTIENLRNSINI